MERKKLDENILSNLARIGQVAYSTMDTIHESYYCTEYVINKKIEGDIVECGVAAGAQIGVIGSSLKNNNISKKIYCYDSFEGIPMACEKDTAQPGIGYFDKPLPFVENKESLLISSGVTVHSLENVKSNLSSWSLNLDDFIFIKGWFQHTLPSNTIDKISLLRLDGDLYESTKVCLEYLYPKLSVGGILIIDDWNLDGCVLACEEYFKKNNIKFAESWQLGNPKYFII